MNVATAYSWRLKEAVLGVHENTFFESRTTRSISTSEKESKSDNSKRKEMIISVLSLVRNKSSCLASLTEEHQNEYKRWAKTKVLFFYEYHIAME